MVRDESQIYVQGQANESQVHLDCRGILFSNEAQIRAIPELFAKKVSLSELSHEAATSHTAEEEVEYLMARGLTMEEGVSTIIRAFLNIDIPGLTTILKCYFHRVLEPATKEAF